MKRSLFIILLFQFLLLFILNQSFGGNNSEIDISSNPHTAEEACNIIKEAVGKGTDIKDMVKTSIQLGYNACNIIKCSIKNGGDLEQIITGAFEAGVTADVISKCSVDAGAEPKEVASIISSVSLSDLCYIIPEEPEPMVLPEPPPFVSPFGF